MTSPLHSFVEEEGVPAFKAKAVKEHERYLNSDGGGYPIAFDSDYLAYLKVAHGRALADCWFRDYRGDWRRVDRIFSYATRTDLKGRPQPSWRPGSEDLRLDYSVHYLEGRMPNWKGTGPLLPFAGVNVEGAAEYDMLCFHLSFVPRPVVVLWEHEENAGERDVVHLVARNFSEFAELVVGKKR